MANGNPRQKPKAKGRKYNINATRIAENRYTFILTDINGGSPNLVFNKNTDNMHKRDYYVLEFHLHNDSGCDLEFVDDRAKVLSACPEPDAVNNCAPEGSNFHPIFYVHPDLPLGKKLVHVINTDTDIEKFCFGFSFVSKDGTETAYFDPGGDNENGGGHKFEWASNIITGATVGLGTVVLVSNSFVPATGLLFGIGGAIVGLVVGFLFRGN